MCLCTQKGATTHDELVVPAVSGDLPSDSQVIFVLGKKSNTARKQPVVGAPRLASVCVRSSAQEAGLLSLSSLQWLIEHMRHVRRCLCCLPAGGPGCGKGTQCERIKARYQGVIHLSAGDLLRDEVKSGSQVGVACDALMKEGKLVPVSVTIQLLKNAMIKSGGHVFLIDGFPRCVRETCRATHTWHMHCEHRQTGRLAT